MKIMNSFFLLSLTTIVASSQFISSYTTTGSNLCGINRGEAGEEEDYNIKKPMKPLPRCDATRTNISTDCNFLNKSYCGPETTGDPRVFGPSVWKFLHILSMQYNPKDSVDVRQCEEFIDSFAPLIPCPHCAYHYNLFLYGTRNPNIDVNTSTAKLWDWGINKDNSPCKNTDNLRSFFVVAHNNVGQHVQMNNITGETRPTFLVDDLDGLYKNVFDASQNKFVNTHVIDVFQPIFLEAINLIAMNYGKEDYQEYEPLPLIKFGCEAFLNSLPVMLGEKLSLDPILVTKTVANTACESNSAMIDWIEIVEGAIINNDQSTTLSKTDRKKRYETRTVCMHNTIWKKYPLRRSETDKVCDGPVPEQSPNCSQPWHPVILKLSNQ